MLDIHGKVCYDAVMGKTSSQVKNRWAAKAYDRIVVFFPKGYKAIVARHAERCGKSMNGFITDLVRREIDRKEGNEGVR